MTAPQDPPALGFDLATPEPGLLSRARRFFDVAWLAARIYTGYKANQFWDRFVGTRTSAERFRRQDLRAALALRACAIRIEGLLIKACQFVAARSDVLPDEWVATLSSLHDRVPPRPFPLIRDQIEREMRRPLAAIYPGFNPVPLASASLAQVHDARLADGRRCAVKVQYPGIEGIIRADLRNMMFVLRVLAWLEPNFDFTVIAREALKYLPMELDFQHEGRNCETIRANLSSRADVVIPEVYWEFTTRRVLTMELVEGIKITDVAALERAGIDKHAVAQKLVEVFSQQMLGDGFFNADPHPGNILVQPGPRLVLLDFGLAKDFPPEFRAGLTRLTFAILTSDRAAIVGALQALGFRTRDGSPDTLATLAELFLGNAIKRNQPYADQEMLKEFSDEFPKVIKRNPIVEVPGDILLVIRVMGLLSGLGKTLDSRVNLFDTIMPFAASARADRQSAAAS